MDDLQGFMTPPGHVHFLAKKLFGESGEIQDGAIAYLEPGGGRSRRAAHSFTRSFVCGG